MVTKKKKFKLLVIFTLLLIMSYLYYSCFCSMSRLPKGKFLYEDTSPKGTYTLKVYLSDGGSLSADAVRVELIDNKKGRKKNIYWEYRAHIAIITWVDDATVKVNDHELNLPNDKYDWRKDKEWDVKHGY